MVTTLAPQFEALHTRIGIEPKHAIEAHADVRTKLEGDPKLREWGVDTILIGSYKRKTSIFPCHDVDVFVKLPRCPAGTSPEAVFTEVERVLKAAYGARATEQRRSMKVDGFPEELSVDAVPAVPEGGRWKIPQTSGQKVGTRFVKDQWETTNPEGVTTLTDAMQASSPEIEGQPSYRRTVRMVRQVREAHLGDAKPGGLYFELVALAIFPEIKTTASYAELMATMLERLAGRLASTLPVFDPAMGTPYTPAPARQDREAAARRLSELAAQARAALAAEECPAAVIWRSIFGTNSRYPTPVFPLPSGCSAEGARIQALPRTDRGSNADRPFA